MLRHIRGMAMLRRGVVPNLVLSQRVLDKINAAAGRFIEDETGESMVGLVLPAGMDDGSPTLFVLDTISPDESAERWMHKFEQGDTLQQDVFLWLMENWRVYREQQREQLGDDFQWDVPLRHLGDWHKQPGSMITPSGGDLRTVLDMLDDPETDFEYLLVPIVTLGHPATTEVATTAVNYLTIDQGDGTNLRIDWWYVHRDVRMFQPIQPVVWEEERLPGLMPYPWNLMNYDRLNAEVAQMNGDGLFTTVLELNVDEQLPLEICFLTARQGSDKVFILVTRWNYPDAAPYACAAPFTHMDPTIDMYENFERLWPHAERVDDPPGWTWTPDTYLIDYIHAIEDHLGIARPAVSPGAGGEEDDNPAADDSPATTTPEEDRA